MPKWNKKQGGGILANPTAQMKTPPTMIRVQQSTEQANDSWGLSSPSFGGSAVPLPSAAETPVSCFIPSPSFCGSPVPWPSLAVPSVPGFVPSSSLAVVSSGSVALVIKSLLPVVSVGSVVASVPLPMPVELVTDGNISEEKASEKGQAEESKISSKKGGTNWGRNWGDIRRMNGRNLRKKRKKKIQIQLEKQNKSL